MALVRCVPFPYAPEALLSLPANEMTLGSGSTTQLNDPTEYFMPLFYLQNGILTDDLADGFEFQVSAVGTGGDLKVQIFTVNADGSPNASVGSEVLVAISGTGFYEADGLNATLTPGTLYGVRLMPDTGVDVTIRHAWGSTLLWAPLGYTTNTSGSVLNRATPALYMNMGLRDATAYRMVNPIWSGACDGGGASNYASNTTPYVGNTIVFPAKMTIGGVTTTRVSGSTGQSRARLVDTGGNVIATSFSADTAAENTTSDNHPNECYMFDTGIDVDAGDELRVLIEVLTTTAKGYYHRTYRAQESIRNWDANSCFVTATSGLTVTKTAGKVARIFPLITHIDDGASASGGLIYHPGMSGGMRG